MPETVQAESLSVIGAAEPGAEFVRLIAQPPSPSPGDLVPAGSGGCSPTSSEVRAAPSRTSRPRWACPGPQVDPPVTAEGDRACMTAPAGTPGLRIGRPPKSRRSATASGWQARTGPYQSGPGPARLAGGRLVLRPLRRRRPLPPRLQRSPHRRTPGHSSPLIQRPEHLRVGGEGVSGSAPTGRRNRCLRRPPWILGLARTSPHRGRWGERSSTHTLSIYANGS